MFEEREDDFAACEGVDGAALVRAVRRPELDGAAPVGGVALVVGSEAAVIAKGPTGDGTVTPRAAAGVASAELSCNSAV